MTDSELLRHQAMWHSFTQAVKYAVAFITVLLAILAWTLV